MPNLWRIDTIMDVSTLLVMGGGKILEQGPPTQLAAKLDGVFARMVTAKKLDWYFIDDDGYTVYICDMFGYR